MRSDAQLFWNDNRPSKEEACTNQTKVLENEATLLENIRTKLNALATSFGPTEPVEEEEATVLEQTLPVTGVQASDLESPEKRLGVATAIATSLELPAEQVTILSIVDVEVEEADDQPQASSLLEERDDTVPAVNILYEVVVFESDDNKIEQSNADDSASADNSRSVKEKMQGDASKDMNILSAIATEANVPVTELQMKQKPTMPAAKKKMAVPPQSETVDVDVDAMLASLEKEDVNNEKTYILCTTTASKRHNNMTNSARAKDERNQKKANQDASDDTTAENDDFTTQMAAWTLTATDATAELLAAETTMLTKKETQYEADTHLDAKEIVRTEELADADEDRIGLIANEKTTFDSSVQREMNKGARIRRSANKKHEEQTVEKKSTCNFEFSVLSDELETIMTLETKIESLSAVRNAALGKDNEADAGAVAKAEKAEDDLYTTTTTTTTEMPTTTTTTTAAPIMYRDELATHVLGPKSYQEAESFCKNQGGTLATREQVLSVVDITT